MTIFHKKHDMFSFFCIVPGKFISMAKAAILKVLKL